MTARLVDIVCPLYNAEKYLRKLHASFLMQEGVQIGQIRYVVTRGSDRTEEILGELEKCEFRVIEPEGFSHSKTREEEAFASKADVVVFVTQDVEIRRKDWLSKLVVPIFQGEAEATFSRQKFNVKVSGKGSIEKYTREKNYPAESRVVSKADLARLGLNTFFFSDAASAVLRAKFVKLGGYDGKDLPISEDMYFAHKLIMDGGRIKYCADSEVMHSHKFSLCELYRRYRLTGEFMKMNPEVERDANLGKGSSASSADDGRTGSAGLADGAWTSSAGPSDGSRTGSATTRAGGGLAKYVLKRAIQEGNFKVILRFLPDMGARWLGMKAGRRGRCGGEDKNVAGMTKRTEGKDKDKRGTK